MYTYIYIYHVYNAYCSNNKNNAVSMNWKQINMQNIFALLNNNWSTHMYYGVKYAQLLMKHILSIFFCN